MLGPSESPLYKLRDRFRWIVALTCASANTLRAFLEEPEVVAAMAERPGDLRLAVDIDPLSMM
jgi:primosomal protein N'